MLDAIGDRAAYIGPIGAATVAKLVHNMSGYAIVCALAETFAMGVKAGVEPLALWEGGGRGARGRGGGVREGRGRPPLHVRCPDRPVAAGPIRSGVVCAQAGAQGRR